MLFNSVAFAVFLPVVLAVYYLMHRRGQNVWLLVASWFFYGWWDWRFLGLLGISTIVDFYCGARLGNTTDPRRRKMLLALSLVSNFGILGFFKYFNFFVDSAVELLRTVGLNPSAPALQIILPVGISFYTFQTLSYTIDVYRGKIGPCHDIVTFALFVAFFPQLVAGPIERAATLLPQLERDRVVDWPRIQEGGVLILLGLFKKVAIADALAGYVDVRFGNPALCSGADLLYALYLFSVQIYCDFSGYSDIARGTAKLLGVDLMINFSQPYLSESITEFWRRWHISLSTWLRDYVFLKLSFVLSRRLDGVRWLGVRDLFWIYGAATMLTMLLGGLWHGAAWTFVFWGALHGIYLAVHRLVAGLRKGGKKVRRGPVAASAVSVAKIALNFHLVALTWIFFRSDSFPTAWAYLKGIVTWQPAGPIEPLGWLGQRLTVLLVAWFAIDLMGWKTGDDTAMLKLPWPVRGLAYAGLVIVLLAFGGVDAEVPFIYFQF